MAKLFILLMLIHLIGLAFGLGAATVKLTLLFKYKSNYAFLPSYFEISKVVTKYIVLGMILLTLSGIGFIIIGYFQITRFP